MEHDFYEEEKQASSRKAKRLVNKRERLQVKNYLKGSSPKDFEDEIDDMDDVEYDEVSYKN